MLRSMIRHARVAGLTLVALAGCEKGPAGKVTEAEGVVTLDGKTLPGVLVSFFPDPSLGQVPGSTGRTDDTGHYKLTTADGRPGAVVGRHTVTVRGERGDERSGTAGTEKLVPKAYTQAGAGNPLGTVEVAEGKKTYDLDLKSR